MQMPLFADWRLLINRRMRKSEKDGEWEQELYVVLPTPIFTCERKFVCVSIFTFLSLRQGVYISYPIFQIPLSRSYYETEILSVSSAFPSANKINERGAAAKRTSRSFCTHTHAHRKRERKRVRGACRQTFSVWSLSFFALGKQTKRWLRLPKKKK